MNAPLRERSLYTGAAEIAYVEGPPSGTPFVLMHGSGSQWQSFLPLLPPLLLTWQVFAVDLRGHGRSSHPGSYLLEDYVHDMVAFLRTVAGQPAALYGYSMGGFVALTVAARHPELVRALIIADTPLHFKQHPAGTALNNALAGIASARDTVDRATAALAAVPVDPSGTIRLGQTMDGPTLRAWAKALTMVDPEALRVVAQGRLLEGYDGDALLAAVQCPTLLIQGDPTRGGNMSDWDAERALSLLRDGTHIKLLGMGHGLHSENAEAVSRALTSFASSL